MGTASDEDRPLGAEARRSDDSLRAFARTRHPVEEVRGHESLYSVTAGLSGRFGPLENVVHAPASTKCQTSPGAPHAKPR